MASSKTRLRDRRWHDSGRGRGRAARCEERTLRDVVAANDIGSVVVVEIDVVELDGVEGDRMSARFGPYGFAVIGSIV